MFRRETDFVSAEKRFQFSRFYNSTFPKLSTTGIGWTISPEAHVVDITVVLPTAEPTVINSSPPYSTPQQACTDGWAVISNGNPALAGITVVKYELWPPINYPVCLMSDGSTIPVFQTNGSYARPGASTAINVGYGVIRDDGSEYIFHCVQGVCSSDPGVPLQLSVDASGYFNLIDAAGTIDRYDTYGTLLTRTWKDGYQLSFMHNGDGIENGDGT